MATIGERLTEARKNFGIDIRSAAEATKIRSDFLAALEENKPERIGLADVYKIGFLRNYSKYLKLDADRIVAEFRTTLSLHNASSSKSHRSGGLDGLSQSAAGTDSGGIFSESGKNKSVFSALAENPRLIAIAAIVLVVVAGAIFGAFKIFGGNADETQASAGIVASTPATQPYEFQIVSKIPQRVTIRDRFGETADRATLLDNVQLAANRPQILVGRGVLEIRDSGNRNLEVYFPRRAELLAANDVKTTVKLADSDKTGKEFSHTANYWTADPYLETRD